MSEQLFLNISLNLAVYVLAFIPVIVNFFFIRKFNSNKCKVNYQPVEQDKSEKYLKFILYLASGYYGLLFLICHFLQILQKSPEEYKKILEEYKNGDVVINATIIFLLSWFFFLFGFYKLAVNKRLDSIKFNIVMLAAISIAIIMSVLSETENFILKVVYNFAYVSVPAFTVYIIQKQDSESSNEKINAILDRVSNIEKEISQINEKIRSKIIKIASQRVFGKNLKNFLDLSSKSEKHIFLFFSWPSRILVSDISRAFRQMSDSRIRPTFKAV
ncbi:hypothetical protein [Neisseria leonii]|uniref:hypothetical protein n=1 Tax=Neisseria leonii TaxID=2995413 RepID=UPI00237BED44|nr:hypothetical protein [Neisseria sp. 3986]MDD9326343.1 hypothetical protein [Neisseria sp. 3986]